jgi:hypothetical protein
MSSNFKLDKETLIKHRFWVALGVFVPLWLIAWIWLWATVSGEVQKTKQAYEQTLKDIETVKNPKTQAFTTPLTEKKETLSSRKDVLWREVWDTDPQRNLTVDWFVNNKTPGLAQLATQPFGTPIKEDEVSELQEYRDNLYKEWKARKKAEFASLAGPMTLDFDGVIGMAPIDAKENAEHPLTNEELWLNQETVWVKRELLRIIRQTLNILADFQREPADKQPLPAGVLARHRFRNSNWELDLLIKPGSNKQLVVSKDSTIKNINAGRRTLPLREVQIWLAQTSVSDPNRLIPGPMLLIQGEPLAWNKTVPIGNDWRVDNFNFNDKQPLWATQWFTWGTSPIKQIDAIELGWQSSRTAFQPLRALKEEDTSSTSSSSTTAPSGGPGKLGGMVSGGAAARGTSNSSLAIEPKRYLQVRQAVRRIPVGIALIIDQAYIEDLMANFANSRLRFQPTQVQWQQASGIKQPDSSDAPQEGGKPTVAAGKRGALAPGGPMGPGGAGGPPGGRGGMMFGPSREMMGGAGQQNPMMGRMMGMQSQMMGGLGAPTMNFQPAGLQPAGAFPTLGSPATGEESDPNLVEFGLYGIISLYDYPPKPGADGKAKAGEEPKADALPKADDKKEATPKADDKKEATPKADDKKEATPKADDKKADDKKADDKPVGGEAKKAGENKGS